MQKINLKWQNPLDFAKKIADNYQGNSWAFLYSGLNKEVDDSFSYIALFPKKEIIENNFFAAEKILKSSEEKWFGYLSYELAQDFEKITKTKKSFVNLPKIWLINFAVILEFDHRKKTLTAISSDQSKLDKVLKYKALKPIKNQIKIKNLDSNFTNQSYLKEISHIRKMIADGNFYQTNLTRKFFGKLGKKQNQQQAFQLFADLTKLSPANYSSFLKLGENYVISSSPELFLKIAEDGKILSRPIKGTAARSTNKKQDQKNKLALKNSAKEKAENLMIVDLVRNDLSRICRAGSVEVKNLFKINSYQHVHHMSSEIHGIIDKKFSALDAIKACFPAGSMTGAPKIKAMEVIAKKEKINRGIYSGAIGFLNGAKSANLSVVIRTLILQKEKFEFQMGGAITFDSDPKSELKEIFSKGAAIFKLLNLKSDV